MLTLGLTEGKESDDVKTEGIDVQLILSGVPVAKILPPNWTVWPLHTVVSVPASMVCPLTKRVDNKMKQPKNILLNIYVVNLHKSKLKVVFNN